jgi:Tetratricopeptide repeat
MMRGDMSRQSSLRGRENSELKSQCCLPFKRRGKAGGNLALLYQSHGRYGEAEPLYQEALQASREVLGPRN